MNKTIELLSFMASAAVLFAVISWSGAAQAQRTSPGTDQTPSQAPPSQTQPPDTQQSPSQTTPSTPAQPPDTPAPSTRPGQSQPGQTPDTTTPPSGRTPDQAQSDPGAGSGHEFVGTVVKQGNKYMFQDATSGQTYDIDHQDEVKKFDGKKVRVRGTLDPQTHTIHVQ